MKLKRRKQKWVISLMCIASKKQKRISKESNITLKVPMVLLPEQKVEAEEILILELLKEYRPKRREMIGLN
jgi:hypothetical protein